MSEFIPMSRPFIGQDEIDAVTEVLRSGWITTGSKCKEFEDRFATLTGAGYALSLSSGTGGMHLVLKALGIGKGDEVITPSMTFASTINQIALSGARPVFADIDYDTMLIKPEEIERLLSVHTKAIIPVHFAGAPADMDVIEGLAGDIPVIEDAAHAIGTMYKGGHIGSRGNIAIFSFHPIKNITTAEGGMVVGGDEAFMERLRLLRFHGIERDAWKRYGKASDPTYDIIEPGFKYNMTDIQASLGLVQMDKLEEITKRRTEIVELYIQGLSDIDGIDLPGRPTYEHRHAWHLFVVKIRSLSRHDFMEALAEANIGYGLHFPACHKLTYIRNMFGETKLPVTDELAPRILSLPLYPGMSDAQVQTVIAAVRKILG
ncbi:MAG: aminotransferase class I/II-fold pyridoxal phosphate-dependent enzyme [Deltaproteobacteria bacterium]|nr:aminotransferase class I/II-fold pyridoxal phosphate-dependent enzyme [Deltaproteobacteria bacterium]